MSITLINASRRIAVINLIHDIYCEAGGTCVCGLQGGKRHARAVTIPAGESVADFDEAVLTLPDVIRAVRAGELRVRRQAPPPKPKINSRKPKQSSRHKRRGNP
ncbi:MAG: hypothetical protein CSB49_04915 [Proteobacteria bacterium]|nr:MAG: hypothetical protein CSB49_04915 [Pseudomonadota bacterium]